MLLGDDKKENSLRIKMISFSFDCNKVITSKVKRWNPSIKQVSKVLLGSLMEQFNTFY
jgi:hypothetical protein